MALSLHIVPSRGLRRALVNGPDDPNPAGDIELSLHDSFTLTVTAYTEDRTTNTLAVSPFDFGVSSLSLAGKLDLDGPDLFRIDNFTAALGIASAVLNLNTQALLDAFQNGTESIVATCDLQLTRNAPATAETLARFNATIYKDIYRTDGGTPPIPADEWPLPSVLIPLLEGSIASATAAASSATTAMNSATSAAAQAESAATSASDASDYATDSAASATAAASSAASASATLAGAVRFDTAQARTPAEQAQARKNIDAIPVGGVNCYGDGGGSGGGWGYPTDVPVTGDMELFAYVNLDAVSSSSNGVLFGFANAALGFDPAGVGLPYIHPWFLTGGEYFQCDPLQLRADYAGKWTALSFVRQNGAWSCSINGGARVPMRTHPVHTEPLNRVLGGIAGGWGQIDGRVLRVKVLNFVLTDSERLEMAGLGVPVSCTRQGLVSTTMKDNAQAVLSCTVTASNPAAGSFTAAHSALNAWTSVRTSALVGKFGDTYRVRFNVTVDSGDATALPGLVFFNGTSFVGQSDGQIVPGANDWTMTLWGDSTPELHFWSHPNFGPTGTPPTYTVTNLTITRVGAMADWREDMVTSLRRWIDSSGNARDLIPGAGITPLAPRNAITRTLKVSTTGATAAINTAASIGTITGVTATDTAAIAAIRAGDALAASWTTSRPANASGLDAHAPTNGAPSVFVHAGATACTVPASTQLNLVHTIS